MGGDVLCSRSRWARLPHLQDRRPRRPFTRFITSYPVMSSPNRAFDAFLSDCLALGDAVSDTVLGLTAQISQKIYNATLDAHDSTATYMATEGISPSDYKKLLEITALSHPRCVLCPHVDNRPLFELSCGHGCCRKCAERTEDKLCGMCDKSVVVKAKFMPRSKLLHDRKSKLDIHARLALLTHFEYGEKLYNELFILNTCVECGVMKKCQRLLSTCGHIMCQHCIEDKAAFHKILGFRVLAKPSVEVLCPQCSVASTVAAGGFGSDPVSRSFYIREMIQRMFDSERVQHPIESIEVRQRTYCASCEQEHADMAMCECKTCNLETLICMSCANEHDDKCHVISVVAEPKDRAYGLQNLARLYHCADQYLLGILTLFGEDFQPKQTESLVERIVHNRDGIATIYEGIAQAEYVTPLMAKKAVKKAEVCLNRLRLINDVVAKEWPRLRTMANKAVEDVLDIPTDDEGKNKAEEREEETSQSNVLRDDNVNISTGMVARLEEILNEDSDDNVNISTGMVVRVEEILNEDSFEAVNPDQDASSPIGSDYEIVEDDK
uniref:RING-type domain-containing protein n=1 Tax=Steinernema glaseri TaxID=37863 RepID=A0A1I7YCS0_9BILA